MSTHSKQNLVEFVSDLEKICLLHGLWIDNFYDDVFVTNEKTRFHKDLVLKYRKGGVERTIHQEE